MADHKIKNYTILINTTDSFEDCWYPFFKLFKIFWPEYNGPIYLNTENKEYHYSGLNIVSVQNGLGRKPWSQCLKHALEFIEEKYILYMQEDYFLNGFVDYEKIEYLFKLMEEHNYSNIHLTNYSTPGPFKPTSQDVLWEIDKKAPYRISTQASLWNKHALKSYIRKHENAWEFEKYGTIRSRCIKDKLYCVNQNYYKTNPQIIPYVATGIIKGMWNKEVCQLFENNGIDIDYNKRGYVQDIGKSHHHKFKKYISIHTYYNWLFLGFDYLRVRYGLFRHG